MEGTKTQRFMVSMALITAQTTINSMSDGPYFKQMVDKVVSDLIVELKNIGVVKPLAWLKNALETRQDTIIKDPDNLFRYEAVVSSVQSLEKLFVDLQNGEALQQKTAANILKRKGFL